MKEKEEDLDEKMELKYKQGGIEKMVKTVNKLKETIGENEKERIQIIEELENDIKQLKEKYIPKKFKVIIKELRNKLNSISEEERHKIYEKYENINEKKKIAEGTKRRTLCFCFNFISIIFRIINLIVIFEGITMVNIIFKILLNSIIEYLTSIRKDIQEITKFSIDDYNKNYNFFYMFFEDIKNEAFDFDLMMFTAFLGDLAYKSYGYFCSSLTYFLIIAGSIAGISCFPFKDYNIEDNTYSFIKILLIFLSSLVLYIGVGASALLSQQVIVDSNNSYNDYYDKLDEKTRQNKEKTAENRKKQSQKELQEYTSLLAHPINSESESSYEGSSRSNKESSINKENKSKQKDNLFNSFFKICITTIIAYFIKYTINAILLYKIDGLKVEYMKTSGCEGDSVCYSNIIQDKNLSTTNGELFNRLKLEMDDNNINYFYIIIEIIPICYFLSLILYFMFDCIFEKKNNKSSSKAENKYSICETCGYSIYSENIIKDNSCCCCFCCVCFVLGCETLQNFMNLLFNSCKIFCCKLFPLNISSCCCDYCDEIFCDEDFQGKWCCCCCEYNKNDFSKNSEKLIYIYQAKTWQDWFNGFFVSKIQKEIIPYMFGYFILQLSTIAFEKQYFDIKSKKENNIHSNQTNSTNNSNSVNFIDIYFSELINNDTNISGNFTETNTLYFLYMDDIYTLITFIVTFFFFIYFTLSFNILLHTLPKKENKNQNLGDKVSKDILNGIYGILVFNGLYALVFSSIFLAGKKIILFDYIYFYLIPILMNKFYYLTLIYYCISYSNENKKYEVISGSTLISLYILLWNTIIYFIREYPSLMILHIIQIIFSFPSLLLLFVFLIVIYILITGDLKEKKNYLCCFLSFICCFGGFWYHFGLWDCLCNSNSSCKDYCKCECECLCCYDFINFFRLHDYEFCCECCNCCECYDCFGCCYLCYCCSDNCYCPCCECCGCTKY